MALSTPLAVLAQDSTAFRIFTSKGRPAEFSELVQEVLQADVVFFGELHGNPIAHRLELQLARSLHEQHAQLQLAMEMFEADNQLILDEYLQGLIPEKHLLSEAKVWPNYPTDYKPLLDFALERGVPVLASNIPRRYANLVYRKGLEALDSLSEEAKRWIAPLPIVVELQLPGYQAMMHSMGAHGTPASTENLVKAQAIKDATMAHFIAQRTAKGKILHLNGAFHSKNREGIIWYLQQLRPQLRIATITTIEQVKIKKLEKENRDTADFVVVTQATKEQ